MIQIPYPELLAKISEKSGLSTPEIESKIATKLKQLSGLVSKEGAAHIIANELGIQLLEVSSGEVQVKDILPGMRNIDVTARVRDNYGVKEFTRGERVSKVASLFVGDETGFTRLVFWGDAADKVAAVKTDDHITARGGYVRENRGFKEVHYNDTAAISVNPKGVSIELPERASTATEFSRKQISELGEDSAGVEVLATVVQMYEPKFFEVCPTCGKRARPADGAFQCSEHGLIEPAYGFLITIFIDDGTENIRAVLFRQQVLELLGMQQEEFMGLREHPETFTAIKQKGLGATAVFKGRSSMNAYFGRTEFIVQSLDMQPDAKKELERLKAE
ncbi:hypothetical protein H6504_03100 [Candidatus Woesearchaeota archaeon]|nr:hypothetical protein [Candidatus Woesearchaeota archaeon]